MMKKRRYPVSRSNIKTGWWKVNFEITLGDEDTGVEVQFNDLSETTQDHILEAIKDGCNQGEVVEDGEDEDDPEDPCDACWHDSEVACMGCLEKVQ
jgi:hypothetical protein